MTYSTPPLTRLPLEILLIIIELMDIRSFFALRRVSRHFYESTFRVFATTFFAEKKFMLAESSLEVLFKISCHPRLSQYVHSLSFSTCRSTPDIRCDVHHSKYSTEIYGGGFHPSNHYKIESYPHFQFYEQQQSDHKSRSFRELLVPAFQNLENLKSICVRNWHEHWSGNFASTRFSAFGVKSAQQGNMRMTSCHSFEVDADYLTYLTHEVFVALRHSRTELDTFIVEGNRRGVWRPLRSGLKLIKLIGPDLLDQAGNNDPFVWRACKKLVLPIYPDRTEYLQENATRNFTQAVSDFVGALLETSSLEDLTLNFPQSYYHDPGYRGHRHLHPSKIFSIFAHSWLHVLPLRRLCLSVGDYDATDLSLLICKQSLSRTLEHLVLSKMSLLGDWAELLAGLFEHVNDLKTITMEDLHQSAEGYEGLYHVYFHAGSTWPPQNENIVRGVKESGVEQVLQRIITPNMPEWEVVEQILEGEDDEEVGEEEVGEEEEEQ
ncbi:hypothetical protein NA57DRAFT_71492 [Rhizodiscina lignyota]|uniref:F-box domain-containing protein n=1 Tax=Rhizodiscina lignyota TaxID=1504668 RepID=A0A9P4IIY9_9PEZI|nr:hypothetical protein NA57DRAFT_71492 [Rhizodiscina lignyota]